MRIKTANVDINIDETAIDNLRRTLQDKASVKIGVLGKGGATGGLPYIASVHEFGARPKITPKMRGWFFHAFGVRLSKNKTEIKIPERSFLRLSAATKQRDFSAFIAKSRDGILRMITSGRWRLALDLFGVKWTGFVNEAFDTRGWGQWPGLNELTKSGKGHDHQLVKTGALRRSITHEVTDA